MVQSVAKTHKVSKENFSVLLKATAEASRGPRVRLGGKKVASPTFSINPEMLAKYGPRYVLKTPFGE